MSDRKRGRPSKLSLEQIVEVRKLREEGQSITAIAAQFFVSNATVSKLCKKPDSESTMSIN